MTSKSIGQWTDVTILFFIRERSASGYDIRKMLEHERVRPWLQISAVTIYQSLKRMEQDGHVLARDAKLGKYPRKQVYAITPKGMAYHDEQVENYLRDSERDSKAFTIGVSCAAFLPPERVVAAMRFRRARMLESLDAVTDRLALYPTLPGMQFPEWIHLAREKNLLKAEIAWLSDFADHFMESKVKAKSSPPPQSGEGD